MATTHKVTQSTIAEHVGISKAAVSLVLSGTPNSTIAPETRARILQAARELGYSTRQIAPRHATNTIGILIDMMPEEAAPLTHDLVEDTEVSFNHIRGNWQQTVIRMLEEQGQHVMVTLLHPQQTTLPRFVTEHRVDGVLVISKRRDNDWFSSLVQQIPAVSMHFDMGNHVMDSVSPDNELGIRHALHHLYALGHRQIGIFGLSLDHPHFVARLAGYRQGLVELALPVLDEYIAVSPRLPDIAHENAFAQSTLQRWMSLPQPPTAALAFNDGYALRLLAAAQSLGIKVPEQLSLIGFDNIPSCNISTPPLTSLQQPHEVIGRMACQLLFERIDGVTRPTMNIKLDVELVLRASTASPPTKG